MIRYVEPLFRPPSEARSLIFQATIGCSNNRCAFCVMYQGKHFRARSERELFAEIDWAGVHVPYATRVFLADGDALALSTDRLLRILARLRERLPALERVSIYGSPQNLTRKSHTELMALRDAGLALVYYGLESGDDEVLVRVRKGATAAELIEQGQKAVAAGLALSVTAILGLGGPRLTERHAVATAEALDAIRPRYASALTLMLERRTPSFEQVYGDPTFRPLSAVETLAECRVLVAHLSADGVTFRANHASNYLSLAGELQRDKPRLLAEIDRALGAPEGRLKPESLRGL